MFNVLLYRRGRGIKHFHSKFSEDRFFFFLGFLLRLYHVRPSVLKIRYHIIVPIMIVIYLIADLIIIKHDDSIFLINATNILYIYYMIRFWLASREYNITLADNIIIYSIRVDFNFRITFFN